MRPEHVLYDKVLSYLLLRKEVRQVYKSVIDASFNLLYFLLLLLFLRERYSFPARGLWTARIFVFACFFVCLLFQLWVLFDFFAFALILILVAVICGRILDGGMLLFLLFFFSAKVGVSSFFIFVNLLFSLRFFLQDVFDCLFGLYAGLCGLGAVSTRPEFSIAEKHATKAISAEYFLN